jgi:hypothetical protein
VHITQGKHRSAYVQFIKALAVLFTIKTSVLGNDDGTDAVLESLYTRSIKGLMVD